MIFTHPAPLSPNICRCSQQVLDKICDQRGIIKSSGRAADIATDVINLFRLGVRRADHLLARLYPAADATKPKPPNEPPPPKRPKRLNLRLTCVSTAAGTTAFSSVTGEAEKAAICTEAPDRARRSL